MSNCSKLPNLLVDFIELIDLIKLIHDSLINLDTVHLL